MVKNLLLADDDKDDCFFFTEALQSLDVPANLITVHDGEKLMRHLNDSAELPDLIFLDLNMPRKNGFQCLIEIKKDARLKNLPVIIYSTSLQPEIMDALYNNGAYYYVRKPNDFGKLKKVLTDVLHQAEGLNFTRPPKEFFLLHN